MTLSLKPVLVIILFASLQHHAFSQGQSAAALYASGESLLNHDFNQGFDKITKAVQVSAETADFNVYIKSLGKLMSLDYHSHDEKIDHVLHWLEKSDSVLRDAMPSGELAQFYFTSAAFYSDYAQQTIVTIRHFEKAREIWSALRGIQDADVAACYHSLGDIYKYTTFDFHSAEKSYETALAIREQINLQDPVVLYRNYYSLAATNGSQRDFEKALLYASKALEIVQTLEPRRQEQCAAMVANIYRDMGRIDLAKEQYLNALNLNRITHNLDNRAWYYLCLGEMFKYEMLTEEALSYYKKAYDLYKLPGSQDQALFLNLLISMFDTYAITYSSESTEGHVKNHERNFHDIGKEIFHELNSANMLHSTEAANAWLIIGKYYASKSDYDSALNSYQQALISSVPTFTSENVLDNPTEDMVGFQYYVNEIFTRKASALKKAFEETANIDYLNKSFDCLELAEQLLSKQRNTLDMEHSKWLFLEENFDLYETIIEQLYEAKGYLSKDTVHARAFEYFERSKARSLADALALTERTNQFNSQDTLFQRQADLKRRLLSAQANVTRSLEKSVDASELSNYRNEIIELDQQIQAVKHQIEEKYPGYFNVKYGRRATPFSKVKSLLKENDRVLLEYFWGSNGVYALSVSEDETVFRRIGSPDSIKNLINMLLLQLTPAGSTTDVNRFNQFTSSAFDLYTKLVTPFAEIIKGRQRIQIIPDGPISKVPFEILLSEASNMSHVDYRSLNYMVKSFAIGYAYSSAMLNSGPSFQKLSSPSLLAMGFTDGQALPGTDGHLSRIIGAEDELRALAERFSSGKFLFGKDANETNFKSLAPDYDIIHLAVHGSGDVEKNFAASLYFGEKNKGEDGELHAYELYGLKLDALMAVLSSCESGLGMGYRGEGMISMASAFTYSGCQNILMSLWKVNDQAAMKLMDDFYGYLLEGETIDAALRQAKLKYLETSDELTADPRIWTPLVAYGNLNPIFDRGIGNVFIYGGLIVISAIVLLSWKIITSRRRRS